MTNIVYISHTQDTGGGRVLDFPRPPSVARTEFVRIPWIATVPYGNIWLID